MTTSVLGNKALKLPQSNNTISGERESGGGVLRVNSGTNKIEASHDGTNWFDLDMILWKGLWSATAAYKQGEFVVHTNGKIYRAKTDIAAPNTGNNPNPPASTINWEDMTGTGTQGPQGTSVRFVFQSVTTATTSYSTPVNVSATNLTTPPSGWSFTPPTYNQATHKILISFGVWDPTGNSGAGAFSAWSTPIVLSGPKGAAGGGGGQQVGTNAFSSKLGRGASFMSVPLGNYTVNRWNATTVDYRTDWVAMRYYGIELIDTDSGDRHVSIDVQKLAEYFASPADAANNNTATQAPLEDSIVIPVPGDMAGEKSIYLRKTTAGKVAFFCGSADFQGDTLDIFDIGLSGLGPGGLFASDDEEETTIADDDEIHFKDDSADDTKKISFANFKSALPAGGGNSSIETWAQTTTSEGNKNLDVNNITVRGSLDGHGTNSGILNVNPQSIILNADATAVPTATVGIEVERGTSKTNAKMFWDDGTSKDAWYLTDGDDATTRKILHSGSILADFPTAVSNALVPTGGQAGEILHRKGTNQLEWKAVATSGESGVSSQAIKTIFHGDVDIVTSNVTAALPVASNSIINVPLTNVADDDYLVFQFGSDTGRAGIEFVKGSTWNALTEITTLGRNAPASNSVYFIAHLSGNTANFWFGKRENGNIWIAGGTPSQDPEPLIILHMKANVVGSAASAFSGNLAANTLTINSSATAGEDMMIVFNRGAASTADRIIRWNNASGKEQFELTNNGSSYGKILTDADEIAIDKIPTTIARVTDVRKILGTHTTVTQTVASNILSSHLNKVVPVNANHASNARLNFQSGTGANGDEVVIKNINTGTNKLTLGSIERIRGGSGTIEVLPNQVVSIKKIAGAWMQTSWLPAASQLVPAHSTSNNTQVLKVVGGVATWATDSTGSGTDSRLPSPTTDNFLVGTTSGWDNKTVNDVKTTLGITTLEGVVPVPAYVAGSNYKVGQTVWDENNTYRCISAVTNAAEAPHEDTDNTNWRLAVKAGFYGQTDPVKASPVRGDVLPIQDSAESSNPKEITIASALGLVQGSDFGTPSSATDSTGLARLTFDRLRVGTTFGSTTCGTGEILTSGEIVSNLSDVRLKTEIEVINDASDKVMQLKGVIYEHNEKALELGAGKPGIRQAGLYAQDVEAVLPEAVRDSAYEGYKTLVYERVVPLLVEALKEQINRNNEQDARMSKLEARLAALENK